MRRINAMNVWIVGNTKLMRRAHRVGLLRRGNGPRRGRCPEALAQYVAAGILVDAFTLMS
ncbi:hypothetical protein [Bradyrhizobium sp. AUGA SZCCT0431]|uniref:hypothetical protein n=1 Tax=Bradyrhizobium sp. AUGA SZCCT0431 TaxID=2807674 RepID=UPI001BAC6EBC|nr:hypothetical protein [Bradyrhizobium sp. AUGA SZCCT0431]MBR1143040.1 hypothetical protein [Bradyrhizobium sp. AUGA SZCCT0431]